jgi:hypothetical protein
MTKEETGKVPKPPLMDFVDKIFLQFPLAADIQNVVRIAGPIHRRIAGHYALAFLHVDMHTARQRIFAFLTVIADDVNAALTLGDFAVSQQR